MNASRKLFDLVSKNPDLTISTHLRPDVDAVCSAYLVKSLFKRGRIVFFDKLSHSARAVCDAYRIKYYEDANVEANNTLLVDVDDVALLPKHSGSFLGIIDHHSISGRVKCKVRICDGNAPSTTYVIYKIMKEMGVKISAKQAELILLGIIADSYRFKSVNSAEVFQVVSDLLRISKKSYEELLALIESNELSTSEKLVYARSFRDYRIFKDKEHEYIFIISDCEGFHSLIATKIVECMGIDFALTYTESEGEIKMAARSSSRLKLHLGKYMAELGRRLGGSGGGHRHAAGANIPLTDKENIERIAVELLKEKFKTLNPE